MTAWLESLALLACSAAFGAALGGLVYAIEYGSRFVPVAPWSWSSVVA